MMFDAWIVAGLTVVAWVTGLWLVSLVLRDSSIVDSFWGLGFVAVAASVAGLVGGPRSPCLAPHGTGRRVGTAPLPLHLLA